MTKWKCAGCGMMREGKCKPKKCKECGGTSFEKAE